MSWRAQESVKIKRFYSYHFAKSAQNSLVTWNSRQSRRWSLDLNRVQSNRAVSGRDPYNSIQNLSSMTKNIVFLEKYPTNNADVSQKSFHLHRLAPEIACFAATYEKKFYWLLFCVGSECHSRNATLADAQRVGCRKHVPPPVFPC